MLSYRQGRFYTEGASFVIPDGFHLDTTPDLCYGEGLTAWEPAKSCFYIWAVFSNQAGTKEELEAFPKLGCKILSESTPIEMNGLHGHWLIWTLCENGCYEARFDLGGSRHFALMVDACKGDIFEIMESPEFKAVLEGIRAEPHNRLIAIPKKG